MGLCRWLGVASVSLLGGGSVLCSGGLRMPTCRLGVCWCALVDVNVHREPLHGSGP